MSPATEGARWAKALWSWREVMATTAVWCTSSVVVRPFTGPRVPQKMMHRYFDAVVRQMGVTIVATGTEKVIPTTPCVIAVNHNSLLDVPIVGTVLPIDYKWVSKKEIFYVPFIGWHLWAAGHIWVDRKRRDNMERLAAAFHSAIAAGGSILMFPEGTRSENGALQRFKSGAFVTAVDEHVPVLPIVLDGTERLLTKGELDRPTGELKVGLHVCDPIPVPMHGDRDEKVARMRDATRAAMVTALDDLRGGPGRAELPTV